MAALSLLLLAGCATPTMPHEPALALVDLPHAVAGITDRRREFAALFAQALDAQPGVAHPPEAWLHGVQASRATPTSVDSALRARFARRAPSTSVLIVPGLFGDCVETQSVPFGDGVEREGDRNRTQAYAQYGDLGLRSIRLLPLPGRESIAHNGGRLAEAIRAESERPGVDRIVLIAYSKGVADVLQALVLLQSDGGVPPQVRALVSVAGLVSGSVVVERFGPLYRALAPQAAAFGCTRADGQELDGLTRAQRAQWLAGNPGPRQLRYFSVVAHAEPADMSPALRPLHAALSALDPRNDGQLLATNALLPHSVLLAEVRGDHWGVALPLERHPSFLVRSLASQRAFPREALFRALAWWVVGHDP